MPLADVELDEAIGREYAIRRTVMQRVWYGGTGAIFVLGAAYLGGTGRLWGEVSATADIFSWTSVALIAIFMMLMLNLYYRCPSCGKSITTSGAPGWSRGAWPDFTSRRCPNCGAIFSVP
jgi:DNA-directed RNA polymerase subunit RPC12/RpoP